MKIMHVRITLKQSKPPIWRRVAVPSDITLGQLHEVIQIAMGWMDEHLHQFVLRDVSLRPSREEIARRSREDIWDEEFMDRMSGLRVFVPVVTPWGDPTEMDGEDEDTVTLADICPKVKSKLTYEYDFGDGWEHTVEVQKIVEAKAGETYPVCLAGKKACPPEDCGGVWGYYHLLHVLSDPKHEDHGEMLEWMGEDFDPDAFDIEQVNAELAQWRTG